MRWMLLACLALAPVAFAQSEEDTAVPEAPEPAEKPPVPPPTPEHHPRPTVLAAAPPVSPGQEREAALAVAKAFFKGLVAGDARQTAGAATLPFFFEERRVTTPEELVQGWLDVVRGKRTDLLTVYGIDLFTGPEMEKKYGKAPARLSPWPYREGRAYLAVANLSGHAAVALVRWTDRGYRVAGYHD